MVGDTGNDTLNGGTGDDVLTGGTGVDVFVFNEFTSAEVDTITDFEDGDLIRLKAVSGGYNGLTLTDGTDADGTYVDVTYADHTIRVYGVDDLAADDFWFI
jgi:Ca2+-binding RTX toxin-like protein